MNPVLQGKICGYCGHPTEFAVNPLGAKWGMVYICRPCEAWVGVHKGTETALGRVANAELRAWKIKAHDIFNLVWLKIKQERGQTLHEARVSAYALLSQGVLTPFDETHIGMFDVPQCIRAIDVMNEFLTNSGTARISVRMRDDERTKSARFSIRIRFYL